MAWTVSRRRSITIVLPGWISVNLLVLAWHYQHQLQHYSPYSVESCIQWATDSSSQDSRLLEKTVKTNQQKTIMCRNGNSFDTFLVKHCYTYESTTHNRMFENITECLITLTSWAMISSAPGTMWQATWVRSSRQLRLKDWTKFITWQVHSIWIVVLNLNTAKRERPLWNWWGNNHCNRSNT